VGLPLSDQVFIERQRDRLVRVASQIAFKLSDKVQQILEFYEAFPDAEEMGMRVTFRDMREGPQNIEMKFTVG